MTLVSIDHPGARRRALPRRGDRERARSGGRQRRGGGRRRRFDGRVRGRRPPVRAAPAAARARAQRGGRRPQRRRPLRARDAPRVPRRRRRPRAALGRRATRGGRAGAAAPPDFVWGRVRCFVSPDLDAREAAAIACPTEPIRGRLPGGLLLRRAAFDAIGPLPTHLRVGEFIAWAARAYELGMTELDIADVVLRAPAAPHEHGTHAARRPRRLRAAAQGDARPPARGGGLGMRPELGARRRRC